MSLKDVIAADVGDVFMSLTEFGEAITYYPRGGRPRQVTAIVDRAPPDNGGDFEGARGQTFVIECANDQATGIDSACIDTGGDQIELAKRVGGTPERMSITQLIDDEGGLVTFEVR